jgi:DNA-binding SARP family transcriptional activator
MPHLSFFSLLDTILNVEKMHILLLGTPSLTMGGKTVQIQRRLTRSLLFYLACQRYPAGRTDLITLFWPDIDGSTGRRRLREILSKLRTGLPDPDILVIDQDQVSLDPEKVFVDAVEFERQFHITRSLSSSFPEGRPLPEPLVNQMVEAVNLWRSPRFLSGATLPSTIPFDRWMQIKSSNLEMLRQLILERLADHNIATGTLELALRWLLLAHENDELNLDLNRKTVICFARLGRQQEALRYCEFLKNLYLQDGQEKLPDILNQIYQEIKSGRFSDGDLSRQTSV